jgi:hypothetical protein
MERHNIFEQQANEIYLHFPKLSPSKNSGGNVIVRGEIDIVDSDGKFWESYQVEIHPVDEFPNRYPHVYETGGKIPRIGDWHIYDDTQRCCIDVEPEEIIKCREGLSLVEFIQNAMLPYFFNQTFRRNEGYYPNGEYAHNINGIFQYYDQLLQTLGDPRKTVQQMIFIVKLKKPGRTSDCFCGSGEKFRRCHRHAYELIEKLGKSVIMSHANSIANEFKLISN